MRQKVIIGLLIIFCLAETRPLLPFLEYYGNFEYISEVLCINKDKPILSCNGKCYLNEQLKEVNETEQQSKKVPTNEQERTIPMLICKNDSPLVRTQLISSLKHNHYYQYTIKDSFISIPTPPPKCELYV